MIKPKYARLERERRFLVCKLPEELANASVFSRMSDLYFEGTRLRLRQIADAQGQVVERKLGQKFIPDTDCPQDTLMTNIYLDEHEYELLAGLKGERLRKRRLTYAYKERRFSIDIFEGLLQGLVLCEIELAPGDEGEIELPPFVSQEVTADSFYTGGELIRATAAKVKEKLEHDCKR